MNFSEFLQAGIFGLTGKPGAGKSFFATRCIIEEIKDRNRTIVTNVPINKEKLREYVGKDFYIYTLETFANQAHFFTNRGHYNIDLPNVEANVDFKEFLKEDDEGVLYVIDEAHLYFNSRNWKHMSNATLSYITFIRHVGDTLVWMCQNYSDIDKQFRGKTQAFHVLRNLTREKIGMFKRGTGFRCYQYIEEAHIASHGTVNATASQDFQYPFDIKVAECYNTSLFNKQHDTKYSVKALPLKYAIWAGVILFCGVLYWLSQGGYRDTLAWLTPELVGTDSEVQVAQGNEQQLPSVPDPFINNSMGLHHMELPYQTFDIPRPEVSHYTEEEVDQNLKFYFGEKRRCVLTYIADKETIDSSKGFSFTASWNEYLSLSQLNVVSQAGIHKVATPFFTGFIEYQKAKGNGRNIKEMVLYLKENIPYVLKHGFEIPQQQTTTTGQFVRTSQQYKEIGFSLEIVFEEIAGLEVLRYDIVNSDMLDAQSDSPVLQTFTNSNVIDVEKETTYQIADFTSTQNYTEKKILSKKDYTTRIQNKIFISYGSQIYD